MIVVAIIISSSVNRIEWCESSPAIMTCYQRVLKRHANPMKHLYNHSCCSEGDVLYVHGGYDGRQASFDFIEVKLKFVDDIYS